MRGASVPVLHEKEVGLSDAELVGTCPPIGHRPAGSEGAGKTPVDESAAPSLPTGWDEKQEGEVVEKERKQQSLVARERH
jgi:hypothetical protein